MDRDTQARARAMNEFFSSGSSQNGWIPPEFYYLFLFMDHEAVVLADDSIAKKLPKETWNEVVNLLLKGARHKDLAEGFCLAIEKCGKYFIRNTFPIQPDDVDELPNKLIIKP